MNAQISFAALAVAGVLVSPGRGVLAQEPSSGTESDVQAQEAPAVSTESDAPEATVLASLTGQSRNNVEVWRLRCTTTPLFVQVARARIRDHSGFDGRRLYFHLKRQTTGATVKTTAPDGGLGVRVGWVWWRGFRLLRRGVERSKRRRGRRGTVHLEAECITGGECPPITVDPGFRIDDAPQRSLHSFGRGGGSVHTPVRTHQRGSSMDSPFAHWSASWAHVLVLAGNSSQAGAQQLISYSNRRPRRPDGDRD